MAMTAGGGKGPNAEINVTPLIDVLLVLLIIFMVIVPTAVHGLDTLVPQPPRHPEKQVENPQTIVVQVLSDREHGVAYKVNETSLSKTDVEPKLAEIFAIRTDKTMFIKGDASLDFSAVAEVLDSARQAGVANIGIITPQMERSN